MPWHMSHGCITTREIPFCDSPLVLNKYLALIKEDIAWVLTELIFNVDE
jgi:hypothetical protein